MAIKLNRIATRIVLSYSVLTCFLFLILYFALSATIREQITNSFISTAWTYTRNTADALEATQSSLAQTTQILDIAILSGDGVFAQYSNSSGTIGSSLNIETQVMPQDSEFSGNGDQIYFLHTVINGPDDTRGTLVLGYDETPTLTTLANLRQFLILLLSGSALASVVLLAVLANRIARPLTLLQHRLRSVIAGNDVHLSTDSGIHEIDQMAANLEQMKAQLVGANQALREEIEHRSQAEHATHMLEERLRHAHRLETIGTLAGGVAHEFNNLLLPMQLHVELAIREAGPDSKINTYLTSVLESLKRADSVVKEILNFSHRSSTATQTRLSPTVAEAVSFIATTAPPGVQLHSFLSTEDLWVPIDSSHVHQMISNLLKNAMSALGEHGGEITIQLKKSERRASHAELSITDNGEGMTEATRRRALDPFFTTRSAGNGTGLGLSVVSGIVSSCSGNIEIQSELRQGTTVTITLPLEEPPC